MKQLLQNLKNGEALVADVPVPTPRYGQALVQTAASLVSAGTERMVVSFAEKTLLGKARSRPDLVRQVIDKARREGWLPTVQAAFNRLDQPMALGYASAGTIVALGEGMEGFQIGQRVACAGAGYAVHAEYAVVPRNLLTPIPEGVSFEEAAFTTLGAIALHGFRLAAPQLGENVAVIGLGLLGLLTVQLAAAAGCRVLGIDLDPKRVQLARDLGVEAVVRAEAEAVAQAFTAGQGCDVVLICADTPSNDPVELAAQIARDRAQVVATGAVGLTFPRKIYYEKELSFVNSRSYGPGRYDPIYEEAGVDYPIGYVRWTEGRNFSAVLALMASGQLRVQPLITHRFPVQEADQAYAVITGKKKEPFLGVLITYNTSPDPSPARVVHYATARPAGEVRLGVIGAGLFATGVLLPALRKVPGVALEAIASAGGLHAAHAARKFGFARALSSADDVIADPDINTVAILTRHDTHADLAVRALQAGKHVMVEKPLALNETQLQAVQQALQNAETLLTVGFNRRFAPLAQRLAAFLQGRVEPLYVHYRVNAGYIPLAHWVHDPDQGGGRIVGEACHFIDFITFLVGAPPVRVSAQALPDQGRYRQDNVSMRFTFADGSLGVIDYLANGDKSVPKERVEVFCGGKVALLDDFRRLELVQGGRRRRFKGRQDKGWRAEWEAFVRAIASGQPPVPYAHLFGVTRASFAVMEALQTGEAIAIEA